MRLLDICADEELNAARVPSNRLGDLMKLFKNIGAVAGVLWAIQLLLFILLFASTVTHLIVQCFVALGVKMPANSLEQFLIGLLKILTWPTRLLISKGSFGETAVQTIWLTGLNSLIWGAPLGVLLFCARNRRRPKRSNPA